MSRLTTPTFVIGLGGIGNLVVRLIHERYVSSQRGVPDTVRLRSIDTAPQLANDVASPLPVDMFTQAGNFNANGVIASLSLYPKVRKWWKYREGVFAPGFIQNGAGAKRPVGRLVFFEQFQRFHDALKSDLEGPKHVEVQRRLQEQGLGRLSMTPRVFIVGSLAGGTGSGTFIDTAFLVRYLLAQLGYDAGGATITAILGLPSVIHVVSNDENTDMGQQRKVNTSAALAELDFLMRGWNDGEIQLDYPPPVGAFSPSAPLYDQVYFFTNRKLHGNVFSQQRDILQRAAHFIFGQIALGTGEQTLAVLDNYKAKFNPAEQQVADGLIAIYGSFGVEWLEVPHEVLMREWCEHIGDDVGRRVRDFDWNREPRQNRERTVWEAFGQEYQPFQTAFEVIDATPDAVGAVRALPDIQAFLSQIQDATNKKDLATALQAFDAQLPGLLDPLRRSARRLPASNQDGAWARGFAANLLRQAAFRAGGARRMLETATEQLRRISSPSAEAPEPVEIVLRRCSRWFGYRVDVGQALSWVRARTVQQAQNLVRSEMGPRAAELAQTCERLAATVEVLQQSVQQQARQLGTTRSGPSWQPPRDAWLLDERDIRSAIDKSADAVTDAVVGAVCEALAEELLHLTDTGDTALREFFEQRFYDEAIRAMEREAARLTRRPADTLERVRRRIDSCEPMAQLTDSGPEFIRIMGQQQAAAPLRIVLTALEGDQRDQLEAWARQQAREMGEQHAPQIAKSDDPLRDDALYLTFGWPLWLFSEGRQCLEVAARTERSLPQLNAFARTLLELEGVADHDIQPMGQEKSGRIFAYAVVLGYIRPIREDRVIFDDVFFMQRGLEADSMSAARQRFAQLGLNRRLKHYLDEQEVAPGFVAMVHSKLSERRAELERAPAGLRPEMAEAVRLVEEDVQRFVAR